MEKQFLYFKEHLNIDLFDSDSTDEGIQTKLQICNSFKVNLLCVSNLYGFAAAGFNNSKPSKRVKFFESFNIFISYILSY